jgi:hypothetical protein
MKQRAGVLILLAALGSGLLGGSAAQAGSGRFMSRAFQPTTPDGVSWGVRQVPTVPGMVGPWGQPVEMVAPYTIKPPTGEDAARAMLAVSMPLELLQQTAYYQQGGGRNGPIMPTAGASSGGLRPPLAGPAGAAHPPGAGLTPPGIPPPPGLPGVLPPGQPPGAVAAVGALPGGHGHGGPAIQRTSVRFVKPEGMKISWYAPSATGQPGFSAKYLQAPARYNFLQASIYRLKISDLPGRPGMELYPTLEVVPAKAKTATFLAHSSVPVSFTNEDFEQVAAGNFVTKVIYLPDPEFQDLAATGPDEVVSSRLQPGVDPIAEAQRRGSILLVVRLGNIDLEAPNTPAMDAPNPFQRQHAMMPPGMPQGMPPGMPPRIPPAMAGRMVPYGRGGVPPQMRGNPAVPGLPQGRPPLPPIPKQMLPTPVNTPKAEEKESKGPLSWLPGFPWHTKTSDSKTR